jgi:multidrug resistance efflux pump
LQAASTISAQPYLAGGFCKMSDDPRNVRIMLQQTQFDLAQALFQLGEAQKALEDANAQLETIANSVGANQRYTHLNRVTSLPAGSSSLSQIETAQAIPTAVSVQAPPTKPSI